MSIKDFHRPTNLATASELLSRTDEYIVPVLIRPRMRVEPYTDADAVVDLSRLKLSYITEDEAGIHIGALTPLQDIAESELLKGIANGIVCEAAELAAHLGLRHIATLGGALTSADGPQELRLALEALGAHLPPAKEPWAEVRFARPAARTSGALERVARTPRDASIIVAVTVVSDGRARVMIGPTPIHGMDILRGLDAPDFNAIGVAVANDYEPHSDFRASAEYRKAMAGVLAQRALEVAWQRARQ
ncbi:MAG: FAD binding domain-containing protein [Anaerolineales bacterium]